MLNVSFKTLNYNRNLKIIFYIKLKDFENQCISFFFFLDSERSKQCNVFFSVNIFSSKKSSPISKYLMAKSLKSRRK